MTIPEATTPPLVTLTVYDFGLLASINPPTVSLLETGLYPIPLSYGMLDVELLSLLMQDSDQNLMLQ